MSTNQVHHDNGRLSTADNVDLYWQSWYPDQPVGVIVLIHGLADHSGRYAATAEHLAQHGWAVYGCDLRGHGLSSDGIRQGRVHINHFDEYNQDIDAILALTRQRYAKLTRVILGHSMGGLIALRYIIQYPQAFDAAVISSPALGSHPDAEPPGILKLAVRLLSVLTPRILFPSDLDTSSVSRDPQVVKAYIDDALVSEKVSARWYMSINRAMRDIQDKATGLRVPTLLMQSGSDRLVDPELSRRWAARVPDEYMDFVMWDGLYHEMLNEPEKDKVRARIIGWLQSHLE